MNEISFPRAQLAGPGLRAAGTGLGSDASASDTAIAPPIAPIILRYLRLARRWKWLLIGTIAVALIAGLILTLLMTPKYTAAATIEIQREGARVVNVQGVEPESSPVDQEFYQTQYGLLKSETLAQRVAVALRLQENAAFFDMFGKNEIADDLRQSPRGGSRADRDERLRVASEILVKNVQIAPERLSRLVDIKFTSPDPVLSASIVNTWTKLFIETSLERRFEATSYARTFLEQRLEQLRGRLQDSERALVQYAANQKIINIPANVQGGAAVERPIIAEDLASANAELNAATASRVAAESRLRGSGGSTAEALGNQAISDLRTRRAGLAADRAKLLSQFQPDYPPVQALNDQIADIDRSLSREEGRVRETLRTTYAATAERESMSRGRVQALQSQLLDLRRRTIQYNIFQREVDTNRQLYDALLQRYKEIGVAGGVGVNNISIVDPALVPERPSSPNLIIDLFLAGVLGAVAGLGLALLLDQADEAISDPRDLEGKLGLPLLGTIPQSEQDDPLDELDDPKSPMVEAYLSVQARLVFTTDHGVPHTLTVTSTRPGEGKSLTCYAIARTLARTSRKVVIVDADMRSPSQHAMFEQDNQRGLSNYLAGSDDLAGLIRQSNIDNLSLLSAGPTPPNAGELLTSDRLVQLIAELQNRFDHVLIDAPPVMGLADTPLIASRVEGCVFVIESHRTQASMAQVAVERLNTSAVRVLGGLLTKFNPRRADSQYGYDYGYGYGRSHAEAE